MTNRANSAARELTTDDVVTLTRVSADEKAFRDERRRKGRKTPGPDVLEAGPCCVRCQHRVPPAKGDTFGSCRRLGVLTERERNGGERGTILAAEHLIRTPVEWDYLRVADGFSCSRFEGRSA